VSRVIVPILQRHWFLVILGIVLALGMIFPEQSASYAFAIPKNWIIAGVLFAMSLPLEFAAMWNAMRRPGPSLLATFISFVVVPLLAWPISLFFQSDLAAGIIIASAVPCSMASVTVWTRLAGGNEAVSILVTVITNLACFVVTPAWAWFLVGRQTETADGGGANLASDALCRKLGQPPKETPKSCGTGRRVGHRFRGSSPWRHTTPPARFTTCRRDASDSHDDDLCGGLAPGRVGDRLFVRQRVGHEP
jgi:hypothetical protein